MQAKQAIITLLLAASLGLAGCEQERPADEDVGEAGPAPRVLQQLNELAIALIKSVPSGPSDPDAIRGDTGDVARTMALLNVAMHDAVK
jgi:predicted small secreted protein